MGRASLNVTLHRLGHIGTDLYLGYINVKKNLANEAVVAALFKGS